MSLARDELLALLVGEVDGFTSRAKDDETLDSAIDKEEGVLCLCLEIERCADWVVVGG